jgi:hypothetical protein
MYCTGTSFLTEYFILEHPSCLHILYWNVLPLTEYFTLEHPY